MDLMRGVLALSGSMINLGGGTIKTTGTGANGAFAVGEGSVVRLSNVKIDCAASGAHGVDATLKGTILCGKRRYQNRRQRCGRCHFD